jgi:DNA-directed RNA polymerase
VRGRKIVTRKVKKMIKLIKDKETKTKIRYTVTGDVSGSIYVDKDSDLAKETEIVLEIAQVTA